MSSRTSARASDILALCERANSILISKDEITEESVTIITQQLKAFPPKVYGLLSITTVLRERCRLPDIFLNPPLTGFSEFDSELIGEGSSGRVYKTKYQGEDVAVKVLQPECVGTDLDHVGFFLQEIQSWKKRSNSPYIAPFYGCSARVNKNPRLVFTLVSPFAEHTLRRHNIDKNTHRDTCQLIIDVAKGLRDLHEMGHIHGNLHLDNVLVFRGVAKLTDFAFMKLANTVSTFSPACGHVGLHPGRVCPEVLKGNLKRSSKSDIFSFGRLVYELFDPDHPIFHGRKLAEDLSKPQRMMTCSWDGLWEILLKCWQKQPDARPTADDIVSLLDDIFTKLDKSDLLDLCEKANNILISTDTITKRSVDMVIKQLKSHPPDVHGFLCPSLITVLRERYRLPDIFLNPPLTGFSEDGSIFIGEGSFGKVYKAKYQDEEVAVKVLRQESCANKSTASDHCVKVFFEEVQLWRKVSNLNSSHIVPFYGCSVRINGNPRLVFALVCPLADHGLRDHAIDGMPHQDTCKLIVDVAKGLRDLHQMKYIHGDVHLDNVLVFGKVAKLADFGLMKLVNTVSAFSVAGGHVKLHPGRVSPEVLEGKGRSMKSDIFSFGRLVYELFDPNHPMFEDRTCIEDPSKPQRMMASSWDGLWEILLDCWQKTPDARPTADHIVSKLHDIFKKLSIGEDGILSDASGGFSPDEPVSSGDAVTRDGGVVQDMDMGMVVQEDGRDGEDGAQDNDGHNEKEDSLENAIITSHQDGQHPTYGGLRSRLINITITRAPTNGILAESRKQILPMPNRKKPEHGRMNGCMIVMISTFISTFIIYFYYLRPT